MRIRFYLPVFLFLLLQVSCGKSSERDVLPADTMEDILWDLSRADELVSMRFIRDSSLNRKQESIRLYEAIFGLHKTSQQQFKESLVYYQENPDLLKVVFDSLNVRQQRSMGDYYGDRSNQTQQPLTPPATEAPVSPAPGSNPAVADSMKRVSDSIRNYYQQHYQGKKQLIRQSTPQ